MFKDVPRWSSEDMDDPGADPFSPSSTAATSSKRSRRTTAAPPSALREYPDRFFAGSERRPQRGHGALRKIDKRDKSTTSSACTHSRRAVPAGAINDKKFFPIYMKCVEAQAVPVLLDRRRSRAASRTRRKASRIDEGVLVLLELKFVTRHGCEPWADLAVKLLLKWPNLYYSTTAVRTEVLPEGHHRLREHPRGRQGDLVLGLLPRGSPYDRIFGKTPRRALGDHVWPKFLREHEARSLSSRDPTLLVSGPLAGIRVLELPNIGPVQFAGMLLSDMGAEVMRLDRATDVASGSGVAGFVSPYSVIDRGRRSIGIDLKHEHGPEVLLRMCEHADVLLEGFRPGVAERLGVGPDVCLARNPRLVYARMTGWGQDGPLAADVGHDVNYLSIAGVLWHIGPEGGAPVPPINLLADFGGGGSLVVQGILAALVERATSGLGQVVDAAMVDGLARQLDEHLLRPRRDETLRSQGTNLLDGSAHFYNVYETSDGEYVSIASYEPKFYANLLALIGPLGFDDVDPAAQMDRAQWPALKARIATDSLPARTSSS